VGHFFKDSFFNLQSFGILERTSNFQTASAGCWTSQVCVVTRDGPNEAEGLDRLSALTSKRRRFILAYNNQPKFGQTRLHKLRNKIISEWKRHVCFTLSVCRNRKQVSDRFGEFVYRPLWSIYELASSVLHISWAQKFISRPGVHLHHWLRLWLLFMLTTPWTIKRWQYICDHNFGKSRSIFIIFALLYSCMKNVHLTWILYYATLWK